MATFTTVGICNHALLLCGASPITSLTEDSTNARALNAVYENSRKSFLTECRWTFALTRSSLSIGDTDVFAWLHDEESYAYTRPTSCLRIWEVSDPDAIWREEGDYIISNTASLGTLYTWDHDQVGLWRQKATEAFIDKLCADISFIILNSADKARMFLEKYEKVTLPKAMSEDSQIGTHQEVIDDYWLKSKFGQDGNPARSYT